MSQGSSLRSDLSFLAYFVRNRASSPSNLPLQEEILPQNPGLQTETLDAAADREAFYTPIGSPDLSRPTTAFNPGTGQRTISASAFRRNKSSLNQSTEGIPAALVTDPTREPPTVPTHQSSVDEIYQDDARRPQHHPIAESKHGNGVHEAQPESEASGEIPPTYHESFTHSPTPRVTVDEETDSRDLR